MRTLLLLILVALLAGAPAAQPAEPKALPSLLAGEPRLEKPVSLRLREDPLVDLLQQVERETGVALAATSDTADERVILFAKERPAREVLARVAEHFDYTWVAESRGGKRTLVLSQSLAAKRREAALRTGAARDFAALRDLLEQEVAAMNQPETVALRKMPVSERRTRMHQLMDDLHGPEVRIPTENGYTFMRTPPVPPPFPAEKARLTREWELLRRITPDHLSMHDKQLATFGYHSLTDDQRAALWREGQVTLAFPSERGKTPLSREMAALVAEALLGSYSYRDHEVTGLPVYFTMRQFDRVRVTLRLEQISHEGKVRVRARVLGTYGGDNEKPIRLERATNEELGSFHLQHLLPQRVVDPLDAETGRLAESRMVEILPRDTKGPSGRREPELWYVDVLEQLAGLVEGPVLSDGYTMGPLTGWAFPAGRVSLAKVLTFIGKRFARSCRARNGYLLLRHTEWANARAVEPPARRVAPWEASARRFGSLRFEELLEVSRLPMGMDGTVAMRLERASHSAAKLLSDDLEQSGGVLRFLATLPEHRRKALLKGQVLTLKGLPHSTIQHLSPVIESATESLQGIAETGEDGRPPFEPGSGFALEDQLEQTWLQTRVRVTRRPAVWTFTEHRHHLIEKDADWENAVASERNLNPKLRREDLPKAQGEMVEVRFELPFGDPVVHYFLDPNRELERYTPVGR